jgi:hypothetical protein
MKRRWHPGWALALVVGGLVLLGVSELTDRLEPQRGLNATTVFIALDLTALAASLAAWLMLWLAPRVHRRQTRPASRAWPFTVAGLIGATVFAGVTLDHLAHTPRADAWLAFAGATMLLVASLLGADQTPD